MYPYTDELGNHPPSTLFNPALVTIAESELSNPLPEYKFLCYTEGWEDIHGHDNNDPRRLNYVSNRYNAAITNLLQTWPETTHLLVTDSYYLVYPEQLKELIEQYSRFSSPHILGASIWAEIKTHVRAYFVYYDTMSVREFRGKRWKKLDQLPKGTFLVSGVGACWIFPRWYWEESGGFHVKLPTKDQMGEMVTSRCLGPTRLPTLLNCDLKLWRTRDTAQVQYDWPKRIRVSLGEFRRRFLEGKSKVIG